MSNSLRIGSPPKVYVNTSFGCNNIYLHESINTSAVLDSQVQDIWKILDELQYTEEDRTNLRNNSTSNCIYEPRIEGYFCLNAILNLSRIVTEMEIKVLQKGLDFAPIH